MANDPAAHFSLAKTFPEVVPENRYSSTTYWSRDAQWPPESLPESHDSTSRNRKISIFIESYQDLYDLVGARSNWEEERTINCQEGGYISRFFRALAQAKHGLFFSKFSPNLFVLFLNPMRIVPHHFFPRKTVVLSFLFLVAIAFLCTQESSPDNVKSNITKPVISCPLTTILKVYENTSPEKALELAKDLGANVSQEKIRVLIQGVPNIVARNFPRGTSEPGYPELNTAQNTTFFLFLNLEDVAQLAESPDVKSLNLVSSGGLISTKEWDYDY